MFTLVSLSNSKSMKQQRLRDQTLLELRTSKHDLHNSLLDAIQHDISDADHRLKRELMPIALSLVWSLRQYNMESGVSWQDYYNKPCYSVNLNIEALRRVITAGDCGSRVESKVMSFLFKHSIFYRDGYSECLKDTDAADSLDDGIIDNVFSSNDYNLELPLHLLLHIIDRLGLFNQLSSLVRYKIGNKYHFLVANDLIKSSLQSIIGQCGFENTSLFESMLRPIIHCINNVSSLMSVSTFKSLGQYSGYIKDQTLRYRITMMMLRYIIKIYNPDMEPDARSSYIQCLESLHHALFESWITESFFYQDIVRDKLEQLHQLISKEKFQNVTVGMMNFKIYSLLQRKSASIEQLSVSTPLPPQLDIKSILLDNEAVINQQHVPTTITWLPSLGHYCDQHYNFITYVHTLAMMKPALFMSRDTKDAESYIHFIANCLDKSDMNYLATPFIFIPYSLSKVILGLDKQPTRYIHFVCVWYKYLDMRIVNVDQVDSLEIEPILNVYFFLAFMSTHFDIPFLDQMTTRCHALLPRLISTPGGDAIIESLYRLTDITLNTTIPFTLLRQRQNEKQSIQSIVTRCFNQITITSDISGDGDLTDTARQTELIDSLKMATLLDPDHVILTIIKMSIKNKGQQEFLARLMVDHLLPYCPRRESFVVERLHQTVGIEDEYHGTGPLSSEQGRVSCRTFIQSFLKNVTVLPIRERYITSIIMDLVIPIIQMLSVSDDQQSPPKFRAASFILHILEDMFSDFIILDHRIYQWISSQDSYRDHVDVVPGDRIDILISMGPITSLYQSMIGSLNHHNYDTCQSELLHLLRVLTLVLVRNGHHDIVQSQLDTWSLSPILKYRIQHYQTLHFGPEQQHELSNNLNHILKAPIDITTTTNYPLVMTIIHNFIELACISKQHANAMVGIVMSRLESSSGTLHDHIVRTFMSDRFPQTLILVLALQLPYAPKEHFELVAEHLLPSMISVDLLPSSLSSVHRLMLRLLKIHLKIFSERSSLDPHSINSSYQFTKRVANQFKKWIVQAPPIPDVEDTIQVCHQLLLCIQCYLSIDQRNDGKQSFYILILAIADKLVGTTSIDDQCHIILDQCKLQLLSHSNDELSKGSVDTKTQTLYDKIKSLTD
ncbi:hypothetical protein SAMD00019534_073830 [Acytostelium subglobosum LB1]|uniref:hypothetical protein n=1 Tax=Acytostelium subglobosum LB1 TaxID=1410327 RepID=UPI000644D882|nr:hypothetical protein SAMD00019534_073830 [Acytostelium subglobosum LB1]GAM24208.1 hypothetical protein SAMD00019534_073830 [Acytostelium subglobosum LB1]|eukprot:XP_012752534.1 hypothetical protein SAMD00019534_073830 [Acytostelium subglobosum LB1]